MKRKNKNHRDFSKSSEFENKRLLSRINDQKAKRMTGQVLEELKSIGAYIFHVSKWDSVYIKFNDEKIRSLRIGDHKGREKYRYKWNLEINGVTRVENDRNVIRFYYADSDVANLVAHIESYARKIQQNEAA